MPNPMGCSLGIDADRPHERVSCDGTERAPDQVRVHRVAAPNTQGLPGKIGDLKKKRETWSERLGAQCPAATPPIKETGPPAPFNKSRLAVDRTPFMNVI